MKYFCSILMLVSIFGSAELMAQSDSTQITGDPIFFVDSTRVDDASILTTYSPDDLSSITVVKGAPALAIDPEAHDGVIFIFTKKFARNYAWKILSARSKEYLAAVPSPGELESVTYVLNGLPIQENVEFKLSDINQSNLISIKVIDAKTLKKQFKTSGKTGVVIEANIPPDRS